jgi:circadian clock protein KaiB
MSDNILLDLSAQLPDSRYVLRLYVSGNTHRSIRAITNLKAICEFHLRGRYDLTVVDLYEQKDRARDDRIVVAPTLVRESPLPVQRMIGDLSRTDDVLEILGLPLPLV